MRFIKMQSCGNDYIYIDSFDLNIILSNDFIKKICSRHFGVGSDGIVVYSSSEKANVKMTMYNSDGSEGMICGNALRCLARIMKDKRNCKNEITIETQSGIRTVLINDDKIRADMGIPEIIPYNYKTLDEILPYAHKKRITFVSVGNPHCVIWGGNIEEALEVSRSGLFEGGINSEAVYMQLGVNIRARVAERGSGETLSCGSGAVAIAKAYETEFSKSLKSGCDIYYPGGCLSVFSKSGRFYLEGDAEYVYEGDYYEKTENLLTKGSKSDTMNI